MGNNKVSEKAVWEGSISPDNNPSIASQMQTQPQMMFCYKCNNVIPGNSTFCPYCQIKLFVECPKCGAKYSSQYPACGQCGTNREDYLRAQRREQERKAARERENRRRQEIEERKRKEAEEEKERQRRIKAYREQERLKPQKEAYNAENKKIMASDEYRTTYLLLSKAIEAFGRKEEKSTVGLGLCAFSLIMMVLLPPLGIITMITGCLLMFLGRGSSNREEFLKKYISNKSGHDKHMTECAIDTYVKTPFADLSKCCVIAYRVRNGLPVNPEWH